MEKVILILAAAGVTQVGATDLDVVLAKARGTDAIVGYPHNVNGRSGLAKLLDAFECDDYTKIDTNNNVWWRYDNAEHKIYLYMIFKFYKPENYGRGRCRWEIRVDSDHEVYIWRWDYVYDRWYPEPVSYNAGGSNPGMVEFNVPASWFSGENVLYLLADMNTESASAPDWGIECDIFDIQW